MNIKISGNDNTPAVIDYAILQEDNTIETKIYDGSIIKNARVILISNDDVQKKLIFDLNDDGKEGDRAGSDRVFSKKIPDQKFGMYRVIVEATDAFGNHAGKEIKGTFLGH